MAWNPLQAPIDYVMLAGQRTPGIAKILGLNSPRRWDVRNGYGLSGAIVVFRGIGLARFTIQIKLHELDEWEAWHEFLPLVARPPAGQRPRALDCWHPLLEMLEVTKLVVEDLSAPEEVEDGVWQVDIKCLQYRRPVVALAKPEAAQATPVDPYDQKIERLTGQLQELAAQ